MPRNDDTSNIDAQYSQTKERIFNDARNAESVIVLGVKGGQPYMWTDTDPVKSQDLLSQFFPDAVLPASGQLADQSA